MYFTTFCTTMHCVQYWKISFISCNMCSTKFYLIKKMLWWQLYCFYFLSTKTTLITPVKLLYLSLLSSRWLCYVYVKHWFVSLNKIKLFINILEKHSHQVSVWLDVSDQDDAAQGPFILIQLCHWSKNK